MYEFKGFTERANEALNLAVEAAQDFGHTYIGSEHVLIGLLREGNGVAARLLEDAGVAAEAVEQALAATVGRGEPTELTPDRFTPRAKRIVEMAVAAARATGSALVGTEHLLLALLEEGDNYAVRFLSKGGADVAALTRETEKAVQAQETAGGKPASDKKRGGDKTPTLDQFGRDLTAEAKAGKLDPVIGRAKEIERILQILTRGTKNNPCLIGEPGVG